MSLELEGDPHLHEGSVTLCYRAVSRDVIPEQGGFYPQVETGTGAFTVTARGCYSPQDRKSFQTQTGTLVLLSLYIPADGWTPGQVESVTVLGCSPHPELLVSSESCPGATEWSHARVEPWLYLCDQL